MWRRWSAHASKNGRREINAANLVGVFGLGGLGRCASDVLFHLLDGPKCGRSWRFDISFFPNGGQLGLGVGFNRCRHRFGSLDRV